MFSVIFLSFLACGNGQETLAYRPKESKKKTDPLKRDQEQIIHPDEFNEHLLHRPVHMPCQSFEELQNNSKMAQLSKYRYSYDKNKKLVYADYFKKRSRNDPDKSGDLVQDPSLWKVHYQYDDKGRLKQYLLLTQKLLLQKWTLEYSAVKNGLRVNIVGEMEPEDCIEKKNESSRMIRARRCTTPDVMMEEMSFTITDKNRVVDATIWSKIKNLPKGTKLDFKYKKQTPYLGKVHFFGRDLIVGQSQTFATLPNGTPMDLLTIDYDLEEKGAILEMRGYGTVRSHKVTTVFTSGNSCDNL